MMEDLIERKIDLAFAGIGDSNLSHELIFETIRESPTRAVLAPDHALASSETIALADLAAEPFILLLRHRTSWYNNWVIGVCREVGFMPRVSEEADSVHTMLGLVAAGRGIALQPELVAALPIDVCLRPLTPVPKPMGFQISLRREGHAPMLGHVLDLLRMLVRTETPRPLENHSLDGRRSNSPRSQTRATPGRRASRVRAAGPSGT
jgi:DNA-binding transcriptional LysR family regulator